MKPKSIWTIGHSTHHLEEFINILLYFSIECIVDVRSLPGSRRYPHFNKEALEQSLSENNIEYLHFKDLGGRRKAKKDSANRGWINEAFRGYADYMETDDFREAIHKLEQLALKKRVAYMCAEAVWWRCHRSLISDYLKFTGWDVIHIMGMNKSEPHPYTAPARVTDGKLTYPKE